MKKGQIKKIIHLDMDCFYAAIEIRDNPSLANKPVAVGGLAQKRGVLCTSNYIARQYGVRSAMPTNQAFKLCKDLVLLPVNIEKYKQVAQRIFQIYAEYTDLVEPVSLDEAYLDVSAATHCQGSATLIAQEIRKKVLCLEKLTVSAGIAPNKFLAKIASAWKKPNGIFVIKPDEVQEFVLNLPIEKLYGVGKVTANKLHGLGLKTCADLRVLTYDELKRNFGKLGEHLYEQCRGIDNRAVIPNRERKSISVEYTFEQDLKNFELCVNYLNILYQKLINRIEEVQGKRKIKNQFLKIKLSNFRQYTIEASVGEISYNLYMILLTKTFEKASLPIRLLGIGVHFHNKEHCAELQQSFL